MLLTVATAVAFACLWCQKPRGKRRSSNIAAWSAWLLHFCHHGSFKKRSEKDREARQMVQMRENEDEDFGPNDGLEQFDEIGEGVTPKTSARTEEGSASQTERTSLPSWASRDQSRTSRSLEYSMSSQAASNDDLSRPSQNSQDALKPPSRGSQLQRDASRFSRASSQPMHEFQQEQPELTAPWIRPSFFTGLNGGDWLSGPPIGPHHGYAAVEQFSPPQSPVMGALHQGPPPQTMFSADSAPMLHGMSGRSTGGSSKGRSPRVMVSESSGGMLGSHRGSPGSSVGFSAALGNGQSGFNAAPQSLPENPVTRGRSPLSPDRIQQAPPQAERHGSLSPGHPSLSPAMTPKLPLTTPSAGLTPPRGLGRCLTPPRGLALGSSPSQEGLLGLQPPQWQFTGQV